MPQYALKCPHCQSKRDAILTLSQFEAGVVCGRTIRRPSNTVGGPSADYTCENKMVVDFTRQKPMIVIPESWNVHTQFDVMDPRAFAGKGSKDRRDFVNETYGAREPTFGNSFGAERSFLDQKEAEGHTIVHDDYLEPVNA